LIKHKEANSRSYVKLSYMKKIIIKFFATTVILLLLMGLGSYFLRYYFIGFPKIVTTEVFNSIKTGNHISEYFDINTTLMQNILLNPETKLKFYGIKNELEFEIWIADKKAIMFKNDNQFWKGEIFELSDFFLNNPKHAMGNKLCPSFKPSFFATGAFCIFLDSKGIITRKEKPGFWY
jgi:hypothetical protein